MDAFERINEERLRIAADADRFSPEQWEQQSLCSEWRVRDVVGHMLASTDMRVRVMFGRLVSNGFNVDRTLSKQARELGSRPPRELVAELRERADYRFTPPGAKPMNLMADTVIHSQDIRRPLGLGCPVNPDTLRTATAFLAENNFNCKSGKRASGLRLVATDQEWAHGVGPEVQGPLEAIMLAICGRSAALADLSGAGVSTLASRCAPAPQLVAAS